MVSCASPSSGVALIACRIQTYHVLGCPELQRGNERCKKRTVVLYIWVLVQHFPSTWHICFSLFQHLPFIWHTFSSSFSPPPHCLLLVAALILPRPPCLFLPPVRIHCQLVRAWAHMPLIDTFIYIHVIVTTRG